MQIYRCLKIVVFFGKVIPASPFLAPVATHFPNPERSINSTGGCPILLAGGDRGDCEGGSGVAPMCCCDWLIPMTLHRAGMPSGVFKTNGVGELATRVAWLQRPRDSVLSVS